MLSAPTATRAHPSSLALAAALHPTAAVCGTPTVAARELIRSIEGMDRARYAGPVGWFGADGDGEWGIALRSARDRRRRPATRAAVRRLRRRRRVRPGRRAGGVRGQAGRHAVRARPGRQPQLDVPAEGDRARADRAVGARVRTAAGAVRDCAVRQDRGGAAGGRVLVGGTGPAAAGGQAGLPGSALATLLLSGTTATAASGLSPSGMRRPGRASPCWPGRAPAGRAPAGAGACCCGACSLPDGPYSGRTASVTSTSEGLAVADDRQRDLRVGRERPDVGGEGLGAADGLAVDRDDRVLDLAARPSRPASRR